MSLENTKSFAALPLEALCHNLGEAEEKRDNICCQFSSALTWKQPSEFMAPRHRQPCAGGMLHHVDVNTEQALTFLASHFTQLSSALCPAMSYLSFIQTDPPASRRLMCHLGDSLNACLSFSTKSVDLFKYDSTAACRLHSGFIVEIFQWKTQAEFDPRYLAKAYFITHQKIKHFCFILEIHIKSGPPFFTSVSLIRSH